VTPPTDPALPQVAVLGTGAMGTALALRLLERGHRVTVWNRTERTAMTAVNSGAEWAGSPSAASERAQVLLLSVADQAATRDVLRHLPADRPLIDLTTIPPTDSRSNAASYGPGLYVTSPIFATPHAASTGKSTILSAGPAAEMALLAPIWAAICRRRTHMGDDHGRPSGLKLMTNYLHLSGIAQLACALEAGRAWGLDDETIVGWLTDNPAVAASARPRLEDMLAGGRVDGYPQNHAVDALRIAAQGAQAVGALLTGADETSRLFARAEELGTSDLDVSAVVRSVVRSVGEG
jgi:3-hydroxyisobutyrate dehydrogenase